MKLTQNNINFLHGVCYIKEETINTGQLRLDIKNAEHHLPQFKNLLKKA